MLVRGFVRTIKDGQPVPDGTEVRIYSHETRSLLQTVTTLGGEYEYNFQGSPGPYWVEVEHAGEVHESTSKVVGMAGPVNIGGIPLLFRLWHDGYIPDVLDDLLAESSGVGMSVTVGAGAAIVRGVLYDQSEPLPLTIEPSTPQGRIDLIALQVVPAGANDDSEGRARIITKTGTPSGSPVAPSLTQTQDLWEIPIAHVVVDAGVSSIAASKVLDRRPRSNVKIEDGYIETGMLADEAVTNEKIGGRAVTGDKMEDDSVGSRHIVNNAVGSGHIVNRSVTASKIAEGVIEDYHIKAGGVGSSSLANGAVTNAKLGNRSVSSTKIGVGSVVNDNLAGGITSSKLASSSVTSAKIANRAVTATKIALNVIQAAHIQNGQITNAKLGSSAVSNAKIANGAVSNAKIASGTIQESRLHSSVRNKLNTYGNARSSGGFGFWINFSSTSWTTVRSHSITIPSSGTWMLLAIWDGRIGSQSDNYGSYQTRILVGGTQMDSSMQNWETNSLQGTGASTTTMYPLSGSGKRTVHLQARRTGGVGGKVEGAIRLVAWKVGP